MIAEKLNDWVTLYEGDCHDVLPLLTGIDAVVTDPPYGLGKRLSGGKWGANNSGFDWDVLPDLVPLLAMKLPTIIWGGNYFQLPPSRCQLIWWKPDAPPTMADAEVAWTNFDANTRLLRHTIAATRESKERALGHPTQKPLRVMRWCISHLPADANVILDPFAGSGTTGVAAMLEGRKCILIEKDPQYCEIIRRRIDKATGTGSGSLFAPKHSLFEEEPC